MTKIKTKVAAKIEQSFALDFMVTGGIIIGIAKVITITTGLGA